jgi:non-heme chloroperoxidase
VIGAFAFGTHTANHRLADRIRAAADPELDPLYELPDDVTTYDVPTHDDGTIHVIERGHGRPLLLLHGVTLRAEVWAPLLRLLGDRFRVIAIDVRGHGASTVGADGVGRRAAAHDVVTLLEHLDLRDVVLGGHSMGGMIIGETCALYPEVVRQRVAGLVLMNTVVSHLVPPAAVPAVRAAQTRVNARVDRGGRLPRLVGANDRSLVATRAAFGAKPSGAAVEQVRRMGEEVDLRYYLPLWIDLLDYDGEAGLESVDVPALVITGSRDRLTPVAASKRIVAHLADGELHVIPGAGHQLLQERPRELAELITGLADRLDDQESGAQAAAAAGPTSRRPA